MSVTSPASSTHGTMRSEVGSLLWGDSKADLSLVASAGQAVLSSVWEDVHWTRSNGY